MATEDTSNDKATKKTNFFLIGLVIFLLTVIVSSGIVIAVVLNISKPKDKVEVVEKEKPGISVPLGDEIIINLAGSNGRRYLKMNAVLEADKVETVAELGSRAPQIRDVIIGILRQNTVEKISEKEGINQVRSEIISGINDCLTEGTIKNLYFTDFVIQ